MKEENIIVYLTKYALTNGIMEIEGHITASGSFYGKHISWTFKQHVIKGNYYLNYEDAVTDANKKKIKKIQSLKKQIIKLESLNF